ncbi:MAG: acylphosphatase [Leptospiraceae bacterium]|nr:acylphosphatase [Leptospiraceae bacterium]MCP5493633.1 acylphosphatase [Leptospiraceae bacterium]
MEQARAEILVKGIVQGVGFRYFVQNKARDFGLKGYTRNLPSEEEVFTCVEGPKDSIEKFYIYLQKGPVSSRVTYHTIDWKKPTREFVSFEIRR